MSTPLPTPNVSPSPSPSLPKPIERRGWPFNVIHDAPRRKGVPAEGLPDSFSSGKFVCRHEEHEYSLYVPPPSGVRPKLIVMLHGCGQDPFDFALGTSMNDVAREHNALVLYPAQSKAANSHGCWNWFKPEHQRRGRGEPAWIAALTGTVIRRFRADRRKIYIAGLSAGGAMAATVARAYPRLFVACGVHSGLAAGSAFDVIGALVTMRDGTDESAPPRGPRVPTIVFHGSKDKTVHPSHARKVILAAIGEHSLLDDCPRKPVHVVKAVTTASGHSATRTVYKGAKGVLFAEHWEIPGLAHAWSGGNAMGSHAEAGGPSASAEMMRFFEESSRSPILQRILPALQRVKNTALMLKTAD